MFRNLTAKFLLLAFTDAVLSEGRGVGLYMLSIWAIVSELSSRFSVSEGVSTAFNTHDVHSHSRMQLVVTACECP